MLLNSSVGEDSWESLGLQGTAVSNQSILKEISPEYSLERLMLKLKLQYLATWCEELTHFKRPWCWERLNAGEGEDRGWAGWMASLTWWTWVAASSGSWWWTGRPGMLKFMGSQKDGHDWATELNWTSMMKLRWYQSQHWVMTSSVFLNLSLPWLSSTVKWAW